MKVSINLCKVIHAVYSDHDCRRKSGGPDYHRFEQRNSQDKGSIDQYSMTAYISRFDLMPGLYHSLILPSICHSPEVPPLSMPKTPTRHGRIQASSAGPAQSSTLNPADALYSGRTSPEIIHTYTRKKAPRRRASSLLSISSNFSNSLPPVEEVFSAIGKPLPPSAIDKINYHFRKLSKLVSGDAVQRFTDETAAFRQTLDTVRRYSFCVCSLSLTLISCIWKLLKSRKSKPINYPSLRQSWNARGNVLFAPHVSTTPLRRL